MAQESDLVPLGPFPAGVNNVAKETSLPAGALRAAVNVNLDKDGNPSLRSGRTLRLAATRAHSLFITDEYIFAVVDGALVAIDDTFAVVATIRAGIGDRYVSYAQAGESIYWSNGVIHRRIAADLADHPSGLATPTPPSVAGSASGGLGAGQYEVTLTWKDAGGRESGASPPVLVTVPANGGVLLTNLPPAIEDAATLQVYLCTPNTAADDAQVYYRAYQLPAGASTLLLGAHTPGPACATLWHQPIPPGTILRHGHGRNYVTAGPWLYWSPALRPGLMHQDSAMRFGEDIKLLELVGEGGEGSGAFIADHKRTYFLAGTGDPAAAQKSIRHAHSVVPGTAMVVPGDVFGPDYPKSPCAFWLDTNGTFCLGLPGGLVQPLTEGRLALDGDSERGAATYREFDGIRQILTSFLVGGTQSVGVADSAVATVRRHGVTVD